MNIYLISISSYIDRSWAIGQIYEDFIVIVIKLGKLSLFITIIINFN